jgi:hypothetical protein
VNRLLGPYLKIKRAKEHLDLLNSKIGAFKKSKCYTIRRKKYRKAGEYRVMMVFVDPPLDPLSLLAGDFVSCLRSSLDHLAFRLAIKNDKLPEEHVSFPICNGPCPNADTRSLIERATKGMPLDAVRLIESFQPYQHREDYKVSHLWRLNTLWNVDKHRHLALHSSMLQAYFAEIPINTRPLREQDLDNGGKQIVFPLGAIREDVKLKPKITTEVYFGDKRQDLMLTIQDFIEIYEFVSDKLIPKFARFFK